MAANALAAVGRLIEECTPEHQPTKETLELFRELRQSFPTLMEEERSEFAARLEALEQFVHDFRNSQAFQSMLRAQPQGGDQYPAQEAFRRQRRGGPGFVGRQS